VAQEKPNWDKLPPRDWGEEQAHRTALEVRRLRGKRTAQWLADRTAVLGYPLSRAVISDLEVGRRRYVTTAELIVLARALDTAPIALLYPAPYREAVQVLPTSGGGNSHNLEKIVAAQWFTGEPGSHLDSLGLSTVDQMNYNSQLLALTRARKAFALEERKAFTKARLNIRKNAKRDGLDVVTDEELDQLAAEIDDLQDRIDELWRLGGRDLDAEALDELTGGGNGR
jgi:hypothetical protein